MTTSKLRAALVLTSLLAASAASAASPRLTYSGTLQDAGGKPVITASALQFRFYAQESGGAAVWEDAVLVTPDASGWFSAVLGANTLNPILASDFAGPLWLGIQVSTDTAEMSPRMQVTSTPSAILAASVDWAGVTNRPATFAVDPAAVQTRVAGTCPAGQYLQGVKQDGSVACGVDANSGGTITGVMPGTGLVGGGTSGPVTLTVNPAIVQSRVSGSCMVGQYVRAVNQDGSVSCSADTNSGGTVTYLSAPNGSPISITSPSTTPNISLRVPENMSFACAASSSCSVTTTRPSPFCALTRVGWRNVGNALTGSAGCYLTPNPDGTWTLNADYPGAGNATAACAATCL
jgi:hypothetical protein